MIERCDDDKDIPTDMKQRYKDALAQEMRDYAAMTPKQREVKQQQLWQQYNALSVPAGDSIDLMDQDMARQQDFYNRYGGPC